jgi:2-keto-4-pentenoate hydratase/2-oxohepta-3-ene-1,7-dioic acid hydratase in catechol pathway
VVHSELRPGDIIAAGEVGAKEPPAKTGDLVEAEFEGIGGLRNPIRLEWLLNTPE